MLGLVVLLIALLLHFTGYRRYSLLLFVFMALRYMKIVPMAVMAVNGIDLAIVYMIIVTVSQRIQTLAFTEDSNIVILYQPTLPFPNYIFCSGNDILWSYSFSILYGMPPIVAVSGIFFSKRRTKR